MLEIILSGKKLLSGCWGHEKGEAGTGQAAKVGDKSGRKKAKVGDKRQLRCFFSTSQDRLTPMTPYHTLPYPTNDIIPSVIDDDTCDTINFKCAISLSFSLAGCIVPGAGPACRI